MDLKTLDLQYMDTKLDEACKLWTEPGRLVYFMDGTLDTCCNSWILHWTHDVKYGLEKIWCPCIASPGFSSPLFVTHSPLIAQNSPLVAQNYLNSSASTRISRKIIRNI